MSVYVIHQYGDTALVAVMGEIDAFNYRLLESELESLMLGGTRHILVDAGELLFCDVSGARALERVHESLRAAGGELFVVPSPTVVRLFTVLWGTQEPEHPGLVDTFGMYDLPEVPPLPRRHAPVLRRIGGGRRTHRDAARRAGVLGSEKSSSRATPPEIIVPLPESTMSSERTVPLSESTAPLPESTTPRERLVSLPESRTSWERIVFLPESTAPRAARDAGHQPAERAAHPALERAAHLRREAAAHLEMLHLQTRTTCAALAEIHDRMAALQAGLDVHIAMRAAVRQACADHFNRAKADRARELTASFPAGSG
ncbi:STAS domain-containing protein [Streptosporangium sp. V21-05]|uniref:STAS domain-containing protein n=1 Tax=Streptosporangium sp. V21-05 TaxID=3446115 RepID=UPI003F5309F4